MACPFIFLFKYKYMYQGQEKMEAETVVGTERTSSIEREPRTLSFDQLQTARELAIYVLSTNSVEEASRIFNEGNNMQRVKPVARRSTRTTDTEWGEEFDDHSSKDNVAALAPTFKDIASAPF